jgi:hypothetical protein
MKYFRAFTAGEEIPNFSAPNAPAKRCQKWHEKGRYMENPARFLYRETSMVYKTPIR